MVLTFDLGSGPGTVTTPGVVTMSQWHDVTVTLVQLEARLRIDDEAEVIGTAPGHSEALVFGSVTYIGGIPRMLALPEGVPMNTGRLVRHVW